jgi:hypothetical protein
MFDAYCRSLLAAGGHTEAVRLEVAKLCEQSRARFGDEPWTSLYQGCLRHLDGDENAAAGLYALAAREVEVLWPSSIGCRSAISADDRERYLRINPALAALHWEKVAPAARYVLMTGADHTYLRRFAPVYLRSARAFGGDCTIHFHLTNATPDDRAWLEEQAGASSPKISMTTEDYSGPDLRAYLALARFLRLADVVRYYHRPVLLTDIDAAFTRPVADAVAATKGADVHLRLKRTNFHAHPWNTIQAIITLIRPTAGGLKFASVVASIAAGLFTERAGAGLWFIDQNVLYSAYRFCRANDTCVVGEWGADDLPGGLIFGKNL